MTDDYYIKGFIAVQKEFKRFYKRVVLETKITDYTLSLKIAGLGWIL